MHLKSLMAELDYMMFHGSPNEDIETKRAEIRALARALDKDLDTHATGYVPYPAREDVAFQAVLASKREFHGLADALIEDHPRFVHSPVQRFVKRYVSPMTPYKSIILYHDVGVGKTCSAILIAEEFRRVFDKPALILYPNPSLKEQFRRNIANIDAPGAQCTGTAYVPATIDEGRRDLVQRSINRKVDTAYDFMGYVEFAYHMQSIERELGGNAAGVDAIIRQMYSDRVIIIDEVHNLRAGGSAEKKLVPPYVLRMLRLAENSRLVLLTATPMYNSATDIVSIINLARANEKLPLLKESDLFEPKSDKLKDRNALIGALKAYVSYARPDDAAAFPTRLTPMHNKDKRAVEFDGIVVVCSEMRGHQRHMYISHEAQIVAPEGDGDDTEGDLDQALRFSAFSLANVAFPGQDVAHGKAGFSQCFDTIDDGRAFKYRDAVIRKHGQFLAPSMLSDHAAKIKSIVEYATNAKGVVFVYSNYISAGILPIAFALEHLGIKRRGGGSLLRNASIDKAAKRYTGVRYTVLCGDAMICPSTAAELAAINSPANRDGSVVKIVLATVSEGLDFKCIREMHLLEPWFNFNKMEQVVGRAVRKYSHKMLSPEERNVTVYYHCATLPGGHMAADERIYRRAARKQVRIDEVLSVMKSHAVDCGMTIGLSVESNTKHAVVTAQGYRVSASNVPGLQMHERCASAHKARAVDRTTFSEEFLLDEIEEHIASIAAFINQRLSTWSFTFEQLREEIDPPDVEVLALALTRMINERRRVVDYTGQLGYLMHRSKSYLFQSVEDIAGNATSVERDDTEYLPGTPVEVSFDAPITPSTPTSGIGRAKEIIAGVKRNVQKTSDELDTGIPIPDDILHDYFVDRLDHRSLRHVCLTLLYADNSDGAIIELGADKVAASLKSGKVLHGAPNGGGIALFLDPYTLRKHTPDGGERQVMSHEEVEELGIVARPYYEHRPAAFVTIDSNVGCQFKVIGKEKNAAGSVCQQTSTIEVKFLVATINALEPKLLRKGIVYSKKHLCMLYEIALRMRRDCPESIMRPVWWVFQYRLRFFRSHYV